MDVAEMESPPSENAETRMSTPASNLDDHRFQPSSLPRAETMNRARPRRGTFCSRLSQESANEGPETQLIQVHVNGVEGSPERAVGDDEKREHPSANGSVLLQTTLDGPTDTLGPEQPMLPRRPTLRLARASSNASRSTSPPNSVDAFADPRRRERSNTIDSRAVSDLELRPQRTISGGTQGRRPTFTEAQPSNPVETIPLLSSKRDSAEADVCFPPPTEDALPNGHVIDFEMLEEFVAQQTRGAAANGTVVQDRPRSPVVDRLSSGPRSSFDVSAPPFHRPSVPQTGVNTPTEPSRTPSNGELGGPTNDAPGDRKSDALLLTQYPLPDPVVLPVRTVPESLNRFSFFSSELDSTIHAPEIKDLIMSDESFRELFELDPEGGVWWLDVLNPRDDEISVLAKAFNIHPLTAEDITTQETREKVELFKQYYFVCFRSFNQMDKTSEQYMEPVNVYIVVFRKGVLSFTFKASPHAASVRRRIGKLRDYVSLSSDWVCYALIDDIVDSFGPAIHDIEIETDVIEDEVFIARLTDSNPLLKQIGFCRRKVMGLMRLLGGKADVIKGFAKRCNEQYSVTPRAEIGLYLGDVQDHVVTMMSNLGHFEKMLGRSHSNYLAQISVEGINQGNNTNDVLSKITVIATILVPLNVICGLFGMNVPVPGRESTGLGWFFGILGLIVLIVAFALGVAKKKKFI
ncbi:MAG: Mg(2+) transporter [Watsoniomyces obsoletus]|nr:MAG: Mg(2+) transporter [Watsoniomyces obsoletus]